MARGDLGIPVLYDTLSSGPVEARLVLAAADVDISLLRHQVRRERKNQSTRYRCGLCRDPVYISNSGGSSHFAHYVDSGPQCAWRAKLPGNLDKISAGRFNGNQEGELHRRILLTLQALCERSTGFSEVSMPNATLFGMPGTGHRFPDLAAVHDGRRVVFELQISKTYLTVISDRETFYRDNGIYLIWLFHNFEQWRERQTERDIVAMRSRQAFELDSEAIKATLETGHLTLRAHWQAPFSDGVKVGWRWATKLVSAEELVFDSYLVEALAANPWRDESILLREIHAELITKFERFWIDRADWMEKLAKQAQQALRSQGRVDHEKTWSAALNRAFRALLTAAGAEPDLASRVHELNFTDFLDRILFLRDGINRFNKQNIAGAIDTVLENWPHFTDTLLAVGSAYGHAAQLRRETVMRKIGKNLRGSSSAPPVPQSHEFDRIVALLCPEASAWVRSSARITYDSMTTHADNSPTGQTPTHDSADLSRPD